MALFTTLGSLSQTAASNAADGSADAPSTIDNQLNLLASFIAQLRDGNGLTTGVGYLAQCRLTKSGSNLLLSRYNGLGLTINGVAYAIPSAGVTLAPTSLVAGTTYYIYAYMNAGVMTLEASTTGHATDTTTGIEIQSGNPTRTLVGMARIVTGPAWADTATQRFVLSWFNQQPIGLFNAFTSGANTASGTYVELSTTYRLEFLTWAGKVVDYRMVGSMSNSSTATGYMALAFDGTSPEDAANINQPASNQNLPFSVSLPKTGLSEGYHYGTLIARVFAGSGLVFVSAGATAGERTAASAVIQG